MKTKSRKLCLLISLLLSSNAFAGNYLYRIDLGNVNLFPDSKYSYTEWLDLGEAKDCGGWSPLASTVDFGLAYQQERTCKQDQVRDATIIYRNDTTGAEKEGSTVQQHQVVNVVSNQEAIGTNAQLVVSSSGTLEFQNDAALTVTAKTYSGSTVEWDSSSNISLNKTGDTALAYALDKNDGWVKYRLINGEMASDWSSDKAIDVVNDYVDPRYLSGVTYAGNRSQFTGTTISSNFVAEAWVKPHKAVKTTSVPNNYNTDGTSGENYLFESTYGGDTGSLKHGMGISVGTNAIKVYAHSGAYMPSLLAYYASIPSTSWTHIAVVVENNKPLLYINGNYIGYGYQPSYGSLYSPYIIGDGTGYGLFYGEVAEARVWNGVLNAQQMKALYNRHLEAGFSPSGSGSSVLFKAH